MNRVLYLFGCASATLVFVVALQSVSLVRPSAAGLTAQSLEPVVAATAAAGVTSAIDDLAAWPVAASR